MKTFSLIVASALLALAANQSTFAAQAAAASAPVTCKDGTPWPKGGSGACRGHGGIAKPATTTPPAVTNAAAAATTGVRCKDGSMSARSGKGSCSGHGGQDTGTTKATTSAPAAAPAAAAPAAAAAAPAPKPAMAAPAAAAAAPKAAAAPASKEGVDNNATGATAKCKDGAYSHAANHSGACSRHGGVAEWLDKKN